MRPSLTEVQHKVLVTICQAHLGLCHFPLAGYNIVSGLRNSLKWKFLAYSWVLAHQQASSVTEDTLGQPG